MTIDVIKVADDTATGMVRGIPSSALGEFKAEQVSERRLV
jgi:hypothetical protein